MAAPALANPALSNQAVFRTVMNAMARPATIVPITPVGTAPAPLGSAAAALELALLDYETPVWLDPPLARRAEVAAWLRLHTSTPITTDPSRAVFAILADPGSMPDLQSFSAGTLEYPDRSTTLILQVARFAGHTMRVSGPGIVGSKDFAAAPLPRAFGAQLAANHALFPRGVDLILVTDDEIAALPRSARPAMA